MARFHVTLKAQLKRGEFYWVCDVSASDEDSALARAEALFDQEMNNPSEWSFSDADIEAL